jgi:hypothetical protein
MASITAVELSDDTCALARTTVRRGEVQLHAVEILDPHAFPGGGSYTAALRQARRSARLPRRARVVLWGIPEGTSRRDPSVKTLVAPLTEAGFHVERVVTPCNALAALARVRVPRGPGATCWIAINRGGVAIVVVRPGKMIYSHSYPWDSSIGAVGSQARLLHRYSLVAYLSPEVKRAMLEARKAGTPVDAVVTCGNLPDLRALTMPLIEELDVEVETLDSLEGLVVKAPSMERVEQTAPAIRLACAGAITRGPRVWDEARRQASRRLTAVIRVAVVLAGIAGLVFAWYRYGRPGMAHMRDVSPRQPPLNSATSSADKPETSTAGPSRQPLLDDPLPQVKAILVSKDRRFATIEGGRIVGVGDTLGRRQVVAIDEKAVVLREPSGVRVRVGLGGRVIAVERDR